MRSQPLTVAADPAGPGGAIPGAGPLFHRRARVRRSGDRGRPSRVCTGEGVRLAGGSGRAGRTADLETDVVVPGHGPAHRRSNSEAVVTARSRYEAHSSTGSRWVSKRWASRSRSHPLRYSCCSSIHHPSLSSAVTGMLGRPASIGYRNSSAVSFPVLQRVASMLTCLQIEATSADQTSPSSKWRMRIMRCGSRPLKLAVRPGNAGSAVQSLLNRLVEHQLLGGRRSAVLTLLIAKAL